MLLQEVGDVLETLDIAESKLCFGGLVLQLTFEDLFYQLVPVTCWEYSPEVTLGEDGLLLVDVVGNYPEYFIIHELEV